MFYDKKNEEQEKIFDERIMLNLDKQKPDFLIISAGFDAHQKDPLASINLVEKDFEIVTQKLKLIANKYCNGRIISFLEGGYDLLALSESIKQHLLALKN